MFGHAARSTGTARAPAVASRARAVTLVNIVVVVLGKLVFVDVERLLLELICRNEEGSKTYILPHVTNIGRVSNKHLAIADMLPEHMKSTFELRLWCCAIRPHGLDVLVTEYLCSNFETNKFRQRRSVQFGTTPCGSGDFAPVLGQAFEIDWSCSMAVYRFAVLLDLLPKNLPRFSVEPVLMPRGIV